MTSHLKLPCGNIVSTFWLRIAAIVNAADIRGTVSQPDSVQGSSLHDQLHQSTKFLIVDCGVYPSLYSKAIIRLPTANLISVLNIRLYVSIWFETTIKQMLKALKNPLSLLIGK